MAFAQIPGDGLWMPAIPRWAIGAQSFNSSTIDATGEKYGIIGHYWNSTRSTKSIRKVGIRFGTVTKTGGSGLTLSLQDVSVADATQPDETQDETVAIANADAGFASNSWYTTGNLSADRSVAFGERLAVVVEYDGSGRQGSDAVSLTGLTAAANGDVMFPVALLKTAFWGIATQVPNVIFEHTDGTFGTLTGGFPCSAVGSASYSQNTGGADEYALEFTVPVPCKVDGAWVMMNRANPSADSELILYSGTSALQTVSLDADIVGTNRLHYFGIPETELTPGTTYYLALRAAVNSQDVTLYYFDVADANHFTCHAGGTSWRLNTRVDSGSWGTATTTRRPCMGLRFSAFDDGASSGGGGGGSSGGGYVY